MKKVIIVVLSILSVIALVSCSANQDEIAKLEERIIKLEASYETHSEITSLLEEITIHIDEMEEEITIHIDGMQKEKESIQNTNDDDDVLEEINSLNANIRSIKNDVEFLKRAAFGESLFDRNTIEEGDTVKGMKLIEIEEHEGSNFFFEGQKKITGQFNITSDSDDWYDSVSFHVGDEGMNILPREIQDYRTLWFEFTNYDQAVELLSPYGTSGTATIVIDQYCVKLLEGCVVNQARLIGVETE